MKTSLPVLLMAAVLLFDSPVGAQVGRSGGGTRSFSSRAVNPNFNPPGSLSQFGSLNPRGSLRPGQNRNPPGSLLRPRFNNNTSGSIRSGSEKLVNGRSSIHQPELTPKQWQLRILPRASVHDWAAIGLQQLDLSLAQAANADAWRTYLQLNRINVIVESANVQPLDASGRKELGNVLARFQSLIDDHKYQSVVRLPGFLEAHTSLQELVRADAGDPPERIVRSAEALNRQLGKLSGGADWQTFLALPDLISVDSTMDSTSTIALRARFHKTHQRMRQIRNESRYGLITDSLEFQALYKNLVDSFESTQQRPATSHGKYDVNVNDRKPASEAEE